MQHLLGFWNRVSTHLTHYPIKIARNSEQRNMVKKTNPDYDLVIKRSHLYCDMKLVSFDIDNNKNLIVQFPIFIQSYTQQPLIFYQIQTVPVHIIIGIHKHSYSHLQIDRQYIALNSETYITVRQQELRTYKRIRYKFYCEELFIVKHKSKYSCQSAIYFDLSPKIIMENCKFNLYYNKTDITPTVLDGRNEMILANWPNNKHIIYNINNNRPVKIPSHPYVLVNRSVLCNCGIEAGNHFLLESLVACHEPNAKLVMYFTVNAALINYLDQLTNLTESLRYSIIGNKAAFAQNLPIALNVSKIDSDLLTAPRHLKDFIHQYKIRNF